MATLATGGCQLHFDVHGSGGTILGIHGSPSAGVMWADAANRLAAAGSAVTYDRRGFGRSAAPVPQASIDLAHHVADAARLVEHVGPPAAVVGRSTGGLVALALSLARPDLVSALVLLEPAVFAVDPQSASWAAGVRHAVLTATRRDQTAASRAVFDHALGPELWEGLSEEDRAFFTSLSPGVLAEVRGHGLDLSEDPFHPTVEQLSSVAVPTLVVSGRGSFAMGRVVDDHLAEHLPDSRHVLVDGGHLIDPAHPEVLRFLGQVLGPQDSARV